MDKTGSLDMFFVRSLDFPLVTEKFCWRETGQPFEDVGGQVSNLTLLMEIML